MAPDVDELNARLNRLVTLAKDLKTECADSADARVKFEALQREIETIRAKLKVLNLP
jgi:hypothetical protein